MQKSRQGPATATTTFVPFGVTYEKIGTIQRRLAWPLHKDDTLSRSGRPTGLNIYFCLWLRFDLRFSKGQSQQHACPRMLRPLTYIISGCLFEAGHRRNWDSSNPASHSGLVYIWGCSRGYAFFLCPARIWARPALPASLFLALERVSSWFAPQRRPTHDISSLQAPFVAESVGVVPSRTLDDIQIPDDTL
ncbi:hypothetical protein FA13DRAFT_1637288 [Coprinellus micaceus]|uniref:Uncharacterized protein n=1 Tax=Coprinellus micaceus TaxID=71717 RepID=A0A4Y7SV82_COPMI|nr:hypothetical protein FA13DRAFT_1637288 [Coprinellus micaceus]